MRRFPVVWPSQAKCHFKCAASRNISPAFPSLVTLIIVVIVVIVVIVIIVIAI